MMDNEQFLACERDIMECVEHAIKHVVDVRFTARGAEIFDDVIDKIITEIREHIHGHALMHPVCALPNTYDDAIARILFKD